MCGIAGIVSENSLYQQANLLVPILAAMKSRGPDGTEIEISNIMAALAIIVSPLLIYITALSSLCGIVPTILLKF